MWKEIKFAVKNYMLDRPVLRKLYIEQRFIKEEIRNNYPKKMKMALDTYLTPEQKKDKAFMRQIKKELILCRDMYQIDYKEYFLYQFEKKSDAVRREYIGLEDLARFEDDLSYAKTYQEKQVFVNKYKSYETFRDFFRREVILVKAPEDRKNYLRFISVQPAFIAKPVGGKQCKGVEIIDTRKAGLDVEDFFRMMLDRGGYVLEELICQQGVMKDFHSRSVNTIRFTTFYKDGIVENMFAMLRMGVGESDVDNASTGGIFADVDLETGIVVTPGMRRTGERYLLHPDSGVQIIGAQIPDWQELLECVRRMHLVFPKQKYIGWDIAYSDKGWVLVEANCEPALLGPQISKNRGMKREFIEKTGYTFVCGLK